MLAFRINRDGIRTQPEFAVSQLIDSLWTVKHSDP